MKTISTPAGLFAAMLLLAPVLSWAGGTVNNCNEAELRAALAGGGTVTFACDGTISLASTIAVTADTVLDTRGHQVTISGNNAVRVFYINTNVTFTALYLTIANGYGTNNGGGIYNAGGILNATHCTFAANRAVGGTGTNSNNGPGGPGQDALGGAVHNLGILNADRCAFVQNSTLAGEGGKGTFGPDAAGVGGTAAGGAIFNSGTLNISRGTLVSNTVTGGAGASWWSGEYNSKGGSGGSGNGGAIFSSGQARLVDCALTWNLGSGGSGGTGGDALGPVSGANGGSAGSGIGGISGSFSAINCTFADNSGRGGTGGRGGWAGFFYPPGGTGGLGGAGVGGVSGSFDSVNCTIVGNTGWGGTGGSGGQGYAAAHSIGYGGAGGGGGTGLGGIQSSGRLTLINCTIAFNSGYLGTGGAGGVGQPAGAPGNSGSAGGGISGGALVNTVLATNSPGNNYSGTVTDLGHNLSSDSSCAFTNVGSVNNTDPMLAPLADNGGPTLTMALLPGSPAIDAGDAAAAPLVDQRGFVRPTGVAADIGAFEYGATMRPLLRISRSDAGAIDILACGSAGKSCRLLMSANLVDWVPIATNEISSDGTVVFQDNCDPGTVCRFYRLIMP